MAIKTLSVVCDWIFDDVIRNVFNLIVIKRSNSVVNYSGFFNSCPCVNLEERKIFGLFDHYNYWDLSENCVDHSYRAVVT